ncbi:MAG: acyl-CoA dehydrogenase [Alphaproteobacteria bacterium]|nr:MAG: acyl-CoA dehydrogenase [Alphaproteobacteria bacterium]
MDQTYLDWPFLEAHHKKLALDLEAWCRENLNEISHERGDADEMCRRLVGKFGAAGWLRYAVPKAYGGVHDRLDVRSLCLIRETLARHDGLADFAFAMQGLGSGTISLFGSEGQRKEYLTAVGRGDRIAAFALSEPHAGSDVAAMSTSFREEGDHLVLNGCKTWISNGGIADYYTVFAREEGTSGSKGISAIIVDATTPGLEIAEKIEITAPHPLARLEFNECRVLKSALIGEQGRGFKYAMATLDIFRTTVGAASMGFAKRAMDEAMRRATSRQIFGGHLTDLQIIQSKLGDMALNIDASALLIYRAAWVKDCVADRVTREAAMAKLYATEAAQKIIDDAIQIFGGQGVVYGHIVERLYREVRSLRIYEGASEVQKIIIAGQALIPYQMETSSSSESR